MATPRKPARRSLKARTPVAEWVAATTGILLTLGVLGYLVREGVGAGEAAPKLVVTSEAAQPAAGGFVAPITVRNDSDATAAAVRVRGALTRGAAVVEERRATFAYVPGRGEVKGGLVFEHDPAGYRLQLSAEGYEAP